MAGSVWIACGFCSIGLGRVMFWQSCLVLCSLGCLCGFVFSARLPLHQERGLVIALRIRYVWRD